MENYAKQRLQMENLGIKKIQLSYPQASSSKLSRKVATIYISPHYNATRNSDIFCNNTTRILYEQQ
jgi:hypothetical protein